MTSVHFQREKNLNFVLLYSFIFVLSYFSLKETGKRTYGSVTSHSRVVRDEWHGRPANVKSREISEIFGRPENLKGKSQPANTKYSNTCIINNIMCHLLHLSNVNNIINCHLLHLISKGIPRYVMNPHDIKYHLLTSNNIINCHILHLK